MRCPTRPAAAASLLVVLALAPPTLAFEVGVAPGMRKILPDTPTPAAHEASLQAARGEFEAFQIVVRGAEPLVGVDVTLSDLCPDGGGACVPAADASLYREHFVDIAQASPFGVTLHERLPGRYPDPLVPFDDPYSEGHEPVGAPFDLPAGEPGVVFVDWWVAGDTPPGTYRGAAVVTASGAGAGVEVPVTLEVWEIDLPRQRTVATAFKLLDGGRGVRSYHGGPKDAPNGRFEEAVTNDQRLLHDHRLDPTYVNGSLDFTFDAAGQLEPVDWSAYDAAVGPWLDGTKFGDGVPVTRFDVHRFRPGSGLGELTVEQHAQAAAAFAEHLDERGWWDRAYVYATDEPWNPKHEDDVYARIAEDAARLLAASDLWRGKVLVTSPLEPSLGDAVGVWCPDSVMYSEWYPHAPPFAGWEAYTPHLAAGGELWFYVCRLEIPPYAGFDIDSAIGHEPRVLAWGAWFERASGLLYWCVNFWHDSDPWHVFADLDEADARNGNGILIYPGDHDGTRAPNGSPPEIAIDGPIGSLRLKQLRDGLEDWELFHLAVSLGAESFARAQVRRAYTRFGQFALFEMCSDPYEFNPVAYCVDDQPWALDDEILQDARAQIARKVQHLLHPDRYPDPEAAPRAAEPGGDAAAAAPSDLEPGAADTATPNDAHVESTSDGEPSPTARRPSCGGCAARPRSAVPPCALALLALLVVRRARRIRRGGRASE